MSDDQPLADLFNGTPGGPDPLNSAFSWLTGPDDTSKDMFGSGGNTGPSGTQDNPYNPDSSTSALSLNQVMNSTPPDTSQTQGQAQLQPSGYNSSSASGQTPAPTGGATAVIQDLAKSVSKAAPMLKNATSEHGFSSVPRELYARGFQGVYQESTKPPTKERPVQSENPQAVWRQWFNDMKQFGYK